MGIFYGDIHYGIKISKRVINEFNIIYEPIFELLFIDKTVSLPLYLANIANIYNNLPDTENYRFELYVDITSTHYGAQSYKGWQQISYEEMYNFINGKFKMDYIHI
jgi:hypothetical protein